LGWPARLHSHPLRAPAAPLPCRPTPFHCPARNQIRSMQPECWIYETWLANGSDARQQRVGGTCAGSPAVPQDLSIERMQARQKDASHHTQCAHKNEATTAVNDIDTTMHLHSRLPKPMPFQARERFADVPTIRPAFRLEADLHCADAWCLRNTSLRHVAPHF
jgi:hypothetical protein